MYGQNRRSLFTRPQPQPKKPDQQQQQQQPQPQQNERDGQQQPQQPNNNNNHDDDPASPPMMLQREKRISDNAAAAAGTSNELAGREAPLRRDRTNDTNNNNNHNVGSGAMMIATRQPTDLFSSGNNNQQLQQQQQARRHHQQQHHPNDLVSLSDYGTSGTRSAAGGSGRQQQQAQQPHRNPGLPLNHDDDDDDDPFALPKQDNHEVARHIQFDDPRPVEFHFGADNNHNENNKHEDDDDQPVQQVEQQQNPQQEQQQHQPQQREPKNPAIAHFTDAAKFAQLLLVPPTLVSHSASCVVDAAQRDWKNYAANREQTLDDQPYATAVADRFLASIYGVSRQDAEEHLLTNPKRQSAAAASIVDIHADPLSRSAVNVVVVGFFPNQQFIVETNAGRRSDEAYKWACRFLSKLIEEIRTVVRTASNNKQQQQNKHDDEDDDDVIFRVIDGEEADTIDARKALLDTHLNEARQIAEREIQRCTDVIFGSGGGAQQQRQQHQAQQREESKQKTLRQRTMIILVKDPTLPDHGLWNVRFARAFENFQLRLDRDHRDIREARQRARLQLCEKGDDGKVKQHQQPQPQQQPPPPQRPKITILFQPQRQQTALTNQLETTTGAATRSSRQLPSFPFGDVLCQQNVIAKRNLAARNDGASADEIRSVFRIAYEETLELQRQHIELQRQEKSRIEQAAMAENFDFFGGGNGGVMKVVDDIMLAEHHAAKEQIRRRQSQNNRQQQPPMLFQPAPSNKRVHDDDEQHDSRRWTANKKDGELADSLIAPLVSISKLAVVLNLEPAVLSLGLPNPVVGNPDRSIVAALPRLGWHRFVQVQARKIF